MLTLDDLLQNPDLYEEQPEDSKEIKQEVEDDDVIVLDDQPSTSTPRPSRQAPQVNTNHNGGPPMQSVPKMYTNNIGVPPMQSAQQMYNNSISAPAMQSAPQTNPNMLKRPIVESRVYAHNLINNIKQTNELTTSRQPKKQKTIRDWAEELFPTPWLQQHPNMPQLVKIQERAQVAKRTPRINPMLAMGLAYQMEEFKKPQEPKECHVDEPKINIPCSLCDQVFTSISVLLDHRVLVHGEEAMLECGKCGKKFQKRLQVRYHIVLELEMYKCYECMQVFRARQFLENHIDNKKCPELNKRVADLYCDTCQERFISIDSLLDHRYEAHGIYEMLKCGVCHTQFDNKQDIVAHSRKEYGMFSCRKCNRTIKDRDILRWHENKCTVNEEKTCICSLCPAAFHFPADLVDHREVSHGLETALTCAKCGLQCPTKYAIHRHLLMEYKKTCFEEEDPFTEEEPKFQISLDVITCSICNQTFETANDLLNHRRDNHGRASVLRCGYCDYKAESRTSIWTHLTKEYEVHKCLTCNKTFTDQQKLNWHNKKFQGTCNKTQIDLLLENPLFIEKRPRKWHAYLTEETRDRAQANFEIYKQLLKEREDGTLVLDEDDGSDVDDNPIVLEEPKQENDSCINIIEG